MWCRFSRKWLENFLIVTFFELLTQIFTLDFLGLFINSNIFRWLNHIELLDRHYLRVSFPHFKGRYRFWKSGELRKIYIKESDLNLRGDLNTFPVLKNLIFNFVWIFLLSIKIKNWIIASKYQIRFLIVWLEFP